MRLTILHFNDLHGRLEQCARLMTLIQRERAAARETGHHVLLLDGGDSSDRARWESDVTKGRANYVLLEAMGVQASVVGNGEALQWGRAALQRLVAAAHFPVLAANLVDAADPSRLAVPALVGSHVIDCGGLALGLLGVTQVYAGGYDRFGYISADPAAAIRREILSLRARGARTLLLLSHLGVARSPEEKQTWNNPHEFNDDDAARTFPELDLIVGGHSHTALEAPLVIGQTIIVQAGAFGQHLGRLDLEIDIATGRVRDFAGRLIPCGAEVAPDPTIWGLMELAQEEANAILDVAVGTAGADLPHYTDRPSPFAAWVADALRATCNADLAILFSGFAHQGLAKGAIRRRDLYRALPGSAHVTAAEVTSAQIQRLVERMLASKYRTESISPHRNAPPLGLPAASSNVRLSCDTEAHRLLECLIDGQPLDPNRRYRLASTYYTLSDITGDPEYDFIGLAPGQRVEVIRPEEVLWEIVEGFVKQK